VLTVTKHYLPFRAVLGGRLISLDWDVEGGTKLRFDMRTGLEERLGLPPKKDVVLVLAEKDGVLVITTEEAK
jgi:hypothetical protein